MSKEKFTTAGFEPATTGLTRRRRIFFPMRNEAIFEKHLKDNKFKKMGIL